MKRFLAIGLLMGSSCSLYSQVNWQNMDLEKDSVFGISTERAYTELLKNKRSKKVIVAIIDSGIDTTHEDLRSVIWTDPVTGVHGWNYIGAETGKEDVTQLVGDKKEFYDSLSYTLVPEVYRAGYQQYRKLEPALSDKVRAQKDFIARLKQADEQVAVIIKKMEKVQPTVEDFKAYKATDETEDKLVKQIIDRFRFYQNWNQLKYAEIDQLIARAEYHLEHGLNVQNNEPDTATGDANVFPDAIGLASRPNITPVHGTHVAGIIGAERNNGKGLNGVADNVALMAFKLYGNVRELRDNCLAKAIRFAVDHGARVVNLSFGKPYTWDKKSVDAAIAYARKKDVLIIHAAGNSGDNLDVVKGYPCPDDKTNWIEVGASASKDDATLPVEFSNYGKARVDVFAPGMQIYSCLPGSGYEAASGTSMAAPVVTGLAALLREYYPKLTAAQVKAIIVNAVVKRDALKDKCSSSGVVNAYNAVKLANTYK